MSTTTAEMADRILPETIGDPVLRRLYVAEHQRLAVRQKSYDDIRYTETRVDAGPRPAATDAELLGLARAAHAKLIEFQASPAGRFVAALNEAEGHFSVIWTALQEARSAYSRSKSWEDPAAFRDNLEATCDRLHKISLATCDISNRMSDAIAAIDAQDLAYERAGH